MKWHAIYSTPAGEFRAMLGIDAAHIEAFCPVERVVGAGSHHKTVALGNPKVGDLVPAATRGFRQIRREIVVRPLFPRYLFARLDAGRDMGRILEVDGVENVYRGKLGKLDEIDDDLIAALRHSQELGVFDRTTNRLALEDGAAVEIKDPRYAGLIAKVKASRSKDRIRVILDNGMVMSVPANKVAKAGA